MFVAYDFWRGDGGWAPKASKSQPPAASVDLQYVCTYIQTFTTALKTKSWKGVGE